MDANVAPLEVRIGIASDSDLHGEIQSFDPWSSDQQHDRSCWYERILVNCARYGEPYLAPRQRDRSAAEFRQLTGVSSSVHLLSIMKS